MIWVAVLGLGLIMNLFLMRFEYNRDLKWTVLSTNALICVPVPYLFCTVWVWAHLRDANNPDDMFHIIHTDTHYYFHKFDICVSKALPVWAARLCAKLKVWARNKKGPHGTASC